MDARVGVRKEKVKVPTSIRDVAEVAGVSAGTVSHVLNGNQKAGIAAATQERVRRAAAQLGYQPNRMARSLGRRRTDTLGLLISGLQNPFFVHLLETAERLALEAGYQVLIDAAPSLFDQQHHKAKLRGWPMDGALMWAQPDQTLAQYLDLPSIESPVVYLSGQPRVDDADAVYFDVYSGARAAMAYLLDRGYRRTAYVFPHDWVLRQPDEPRYRAYREACAEAGLAPQFLLMERKEETRRAGFEMGCLLAAMPEGTRPEAILCFNDVVAQGILFGARRAGLQLPRDMAIVGFDGLEEGEYLDTPLTTVELPSEPFCRAAMTMLLGRLKEGMDDLPQSGSPRIIKVPTQLRIGATA